eukprot:767732-Hanusia_phi.AAC.3
MTAPPSPDDDRSVHRSWHESHPGEPPGLLGGLGTAAALTLWQVTPARPAGPALGPLHRESQ